MKEDKYKIMIAGYVDGELTPDERESFESHLGGCPECRKELETFRKLKEITGAMKYADIPSHVWGNYWNSLYRRAELGIGWILFSIGAMILLGYGLYFFIRDFFFDPLQPLLLKIGIGAGVTGIVVLLISAVRERFFAYRRDRYREVER